MTNKQKWVNEIIEECVKNATNSNKKMNESEMFKAVTKSIVRDAAKTLDETWASWEVEPDSKELREKFQKGNVVTFIKSKGKTGAKVMEIAKLQDIDPKKYRDLLKSALEQVLDALGITFEEIKGIKKMDAFF